MQRTLLWVLRVLGFVVLLCMVGAPEVSAKARRKAILFLLGVIVVIVLNALERWLFW